MKRPAFLCVSVSFIAIAWIGNSLSVAGDAGKDKASSTTQNILKIDDIYPVYGPCGSRRHTAFVAGEKMYFAIRISGLGAAVDEKWLSLITYSIRDSSGRSLEDSADGLSRRSLPLGGGVARFCFSPNERTSVPPGRYTVQVRVVDGTARQLAERRLDIEVIDRFCISQAGLYRDSERLHASSGNITQGDPVYVHFKIYAPKDGNSKAAVNASLTLFDHNDNAIISLQSQRMLSKNTGKSQALFSGCTPFSIPETGAYRIHIAAQDVSTGKVEQCDIPVMVHPIAATLSEGDTSATRNSFNTTKRSAIPHGEKLLSINAWSTTGRFGSPRSATFLPAESMFFSVAIDGLSGDEDELADYSLELFMLDSGSLTNANGKRRSLSKRVQQLPLGNVRSTKGEFVWTPDVNALETKPGRYAARFIVKDNITNRTASKDLTIRVLDKDTFALANLDLSNDEDGKVSTGPNLTVGEAIYSRCGIYLPKKSNGHDVEIKASFLDANRKELASMKPHRMNNVISVASYRYAPVVPVCVQPFTPNRPGSYFIRLELKDLVTQETVSKEMPFNVFLPPELPEAKKAAESPSGSEPTR
jgi:hypothetical protein